MDERTRNGFAEASDGVSGKLPVHADAAHTAIHAFAVAEQPVNAFLFAVDAVVFVVDPALIQPFFMKFFYFFDISAAERFIAVLALVFSHKCVYEVFLLVQGASA